MTDTTQTTQQEARYDARIARLREVLREVGADAVMLTSSENMQYFLGFTGDDCYGLVTPDTRQLFVDSRYTEQAKEECPGTDVVLAVGGTAKRVSQALEEASVSTLALEDRSLPWAEVLGLKKRGESLTLKAISQELSRLRMVKDEGEIATIRKAIGIADEAFGRTLEVIRPGVTEREVATHLEHQMRLLGASGVSFTTIVASGYRGAMPHGAASEKVIEEHDGVTIDFGCVYRGYCSDATRTVFVGTPTDKMREVYETVLKAQTATCEALKPGMTGREIDAVARDIIGAAGYGEYFGHSLGHSLGLLVHEPPAAAPKSEDVFRPGMFVTVEPGIYLPGVGGVRIEDTCLLTEDGAEILTDLPKDLTVLPV